MASAPPVASASALDDYGRSAAPEWTGIDWREHQRWVSSEGRAVNVVALGSGRGDPMVLIHGVDGCWTDWLEQLPELSRDRRVVALDLPGFGWSELPANPVSIRGYAQCVEAVCDGLGIARAQLVGHSLGGLVAAELALSSPGRVERLALVAPAIYWRNQPGARRLMASGRVLERYSDWAAARWHFALRRPRVRQASLSRAVAHPDRLPPETVYEMLKPVGTAAALRQALRALWEHDIREEVGRIAAPSLVVWGAEDRIISPRFAERLGERLPDARVEVFEDTGHCPQLEHPERFNRVLREFASA